MDEKRSAIKTPLLPHQQRVVDRIQEEDQPGLVVIHGLGSGKTLTSIAAQEALGTPSKVIAPASLLGNYQKERKKHLTGDSQRASLESVQNMALKRRAPGSPLLVVDEAHRARDPASSTFQTLKKNTADKRLLLSGSPFYNHPSDIAPLIDLAAGSNVLPVDRGEFSKRYISERQVNPGLFDTIANHFRSEENKVLPGVVPELRQKTAPELRKTFSKWVDYYPGGKENFPEVEHKNVEVPMAPEQLKVYDTLMDKAPPWVAAKVRKGLPPNKREAQQLNSFLSASRQASNTTSPFVQEQQPSHDPKIQAAFGNLQKLLAEDPEARAVVYSNFLSAGIDPYKKKLQEANIPYGEFTGEMPHAQREQLVRDYNEGKLRALLLSSAGGEGLDLKGTRLMQVLEPHWNYEKLKQVEGRGARYMSHADLPPEKRKLLIENYLSTRPQGRLRKLVGMKPDKSVDQYLSQMSYDKEKLINQFRALLPNQEKTGMFKGALIERLVRLGATDVPGTPRLLMRQRSPEELAALQHGVEGAFKKVEEPAKESVGKLLGNIPHEGARKVLQGGANLLIENPETIPMQALPVPGLMPGWLAAKKGIEKVIDRVVPAKLAFSTNAFSGPMNPNIQSGASYQPGMKLPSLRTPIQKTAVSDEWVQRETSNRAREKSPARLEKAKSRIEKTDSNGFVHYGQLGGDDQRRARQRDIAKKEIRIATLLAKEGAGAPTRGNFMMASDVPPMRAPGLRTAIEKSGDMLPDYVTYNQGDFKKAKLSAGQNESIDENAKSSLPEDFKKVGGVPTLQAAQSAKGVGTFKPGKLPGPSIAEIAKPKGRGFGTGIAGAFKPSTGIGGTAPVGLQSSPGALK